MTVMCVLLFMLEVSMLRKCKGDGNDGGGVVSVSAGK